MSLPSRGSRNGHLLPPHAPELNGHLPHAPALNGHLPPHAASSLIYQSPPMTRPTCHHLVHHTSHHLICHHHMSMPRPLTPRRTGYTPLPAMTRNSNDTTPQSECVWYAVRQRSTRLVYFIPIALRHCYLVLRSMPRTLDRTPSSAHAREYYARAIRTSWAVRYVLHRLSYGLITEGRKYGQSGPEWAFSQKGGGCRV